MMKRAPTHPGEILLEEFLKPKAMTQLAAADATGFSINDLNELVKGKRGVTAETAPRLAALTGTTPEFWLNLQNAVDLHRAQASADGAPPATDQNDELVSRLYDVVRGLDRIRQRYHGLPGPQSSYQVEASARISQAWYALREFRQHEQTIRIGDAKFDWVGPNFEYLRFYAEAFYYFAWRFCCIVQLLEVVHEGQTVTPFKGLTCLGIRAARNRLIEHGEKKGGILANHFMTDCPQGFVIQPWSTDDNGPIDRGLYPNALELVTKVTERLVRIGIVSSEPR